MNKNDLRYVKTENLIRSVYLDLLQQKKSPVTVTELCNTALINKSTFYAHYETINDLHTLLCNAKIHEIFSACNSDITLFFTDTESCIKSIFRQISIYRTELGLLFPNWIDMISPLEQEFISMYEEIGISPDQKNALRFCIGGILHLMSANDTSHCEEVVIDLSRKCIS